MKQKFNVITSTCVPLPLENVDTDQIIPARFLKATTREEKFFGDNLFRDWRYNADGSLNQDFVLNDPGLCIERPDLRRADIGGGQELRFRVKPRTCCVGDCRLRFPRGGQQLLCRYPQEQRTEQLRPARRGERILPTGAVR